MAMIRNNHDVTREHTERFLLLLEPVHDNLARFAQSMTSSREEAADLVSETVLRALESFGELKDEKAFLGWLFTIATRLNRRKSMRDKLFGRFNEKEIEQRPSAGPSPEIGHDISMLYQAMAGLRQTEREAVVLFEIVGLSLEEVRQIQGGSLSGVKSRLVRGRKKLARLLGDDDNRNIESGNADSTGSRSTETSDSGSIIYATVHKR